MLVGEHKGKLVQDVKKLIQKILIDQVCVFIYIYVSCDGWWGVYILVDRVIVYLFACQFVLLFDSSAFDRNSKHSRKK